MSDENIDQDIQRQYNQTIHPRLTKELRKVCGRADFLIELLKASATSPDQRLASPSIVLWYEKGNEKQRAALEKFKCECRWLQVHLLQYSAQCYVFEDLPARLSRLMNRALLQHMQIADCTILAPQHGRSPYGATVTNQGGRRQTFGGWLLVDENQAFGLTTRHGFQHLNDDTEASDGKLGSSSSKMVFEVSAVRDSSRLNEGPNSLMHDDVTGPKMSEIHLEKDVNHLIPGSARQGILSSVPDTRSATAYYPKGLDAMKGDAESPEPDWDWVLLDVHNESASTLEAEMANIEYNSLFSKGDYREFVQPSGRVTVPIAGVGLCRGTLSATKASFFIGSSLHDVRRITMDQILPPGSSGTWVDYEGYACGVVVAARQDVPWAYMIPIGPILDDIKAALKTTNVRIPVAGELQSSFLDTIVKSPNLNLIGNSAPHVALPASIVDTTSSENALIPPQNTTPQATQAHSYSATLPLKRGHGSLRERWRRLGQGRRRIDSKPSEDDKLSTQASSESSSWTTNTETTRSSVPTSVDTEKTHQPRHNLAVSRRSTKTQETIDSLRNGQDHGKQSRQPPNSVPYVSSRSKIPYPHVLLHPPTSESQGPTSQRNASKAQDLNDFIQQVQYHGQHNNHAAQSNVPETIEESHQWRSSSRLKHLERLQLTYSRATSNASSIMTEDSHWDDILPEKVDCKLQLHLDSNEVASPLWPIPIEWVEKRSFQRISDAADKCLDEAKRQRQEKSPDPDLPLAEHYLENGSCRIVGKRNATNPRKLEDRRQIVDVLVPAICRFIGEHPRQRFEVEVKWHYSTISIKKKPGVPYRITMRDAIHEKRRENFAKVRYFPRSDLNRIMLASTSQVLIDEDNTVKNKEALKRLIYPNKAERLLAVCAYLMLDLSFLEDLLRANPTFNDQNCPKKNQRPEGINKADYDQFVDMAPSFFAHKFGDEEQADPEAYANIPDDVVVPIHFKDTDLLGAGAFSEVFKATIHPWHHLFSQDKTQAFALKIFKARSNQSEEKRMAKFQQERKMLRMLKAYRHSHNDHVVTHHAAWTQNGSFYILFPLATCNLKQFMELLPQLSLLPNCDTPVEMPYNPDTRTPILDKKFAFWFLNQLMGLAEGIQKVHQLAKVRVQESDGSGLTIPSTSQSAATGFHHDIKPDNILVFIDANEKNSYGTLKIGDFGSGRAVILSPSEFYTKNSTETPLFTKENTGAITYASPDIWLTGKMSRASDIWSLGCVFLEMLCWAFLPNMANERSFSTERTTENLLSSGAAQVADNRFWCVWKGPKGQRGSSQPHVIVNAAVRKKFAALKRMHHQEPRINAFGIVISCTEKMLEIDQSSRIDAERLKFALRAALFNAEAVLQYREDTDLYLLSEEPVRPSSPYLAAFPTSTSLPSAGSDLPDLAETPTDLFFLWPKQPPTQDRESSPTSSEAALILAGKVTTKPHEAASLTEDQQSEEQLDLDADETVTNSPDESWREKILASPGTQHTSSLWNVR
jgi:serine/threonine protein kinase